VHVADPKEGRWWLAGEEGRGNDRPDEVVDKVLAAFKPWFELRKARHTAYMGEYGVSRQDYGQTTNRPLAEDINFAHATNVIDTVVTKVCKSRIVPMALTSGGAWEERQKAKQFNRFISGLFWEAGVFDNDYRWTTDALIKDCGVAKVVERGGKCVIERCDPDSVFWDPGEALMTGRVRTSYEESFIDRYQLLALMKKWGGEANSPEARKHVLELRYEGADDPVYNSPHNQDLIRVREAWHLPSGTGEKDGKHCICVKGYTLVLEDYDFEHLPHVFLTRQFPLYGLTAPPMMAKLLGPQREFDRLMEKLREGHSLLGSPHVFVRRQAKINKAEIDNVPGTIIEVDDPNGDIKEWNPAPANQQTYNFADTILANMEKAAGLPETNISGKPAEGITAAKAIQLLDDIVAEKLVQFIRCREAFYCAMAERALEVVRTCSTGGDYTVLAETKEGRRLEKIEFKEVDIPVGSYKLKVFPTSFLSQSPAARYEFLSEMRQRNDIDELEFRQLLDMPDLEAENDLETSTLDIIDQTIDAILSRGLAPVAEAFDDHVLIVQRGAKAYNLARLRAPEPGTAEYRKFLPRLRALKEYILSAKFYLEPPPEAAPGMVDPATGAPPPVDPATGMPMQAPMDAGIMSGIPQGPMGPPPVPIAPGTPPGQNPFVPPAEALSNF
jgi:hypothetical protein